MSEEVDDWVSDCCLTPAIFQLYHDQVNFQWDDDYEVCFVLDQQT